MNKHYTIKQPIISKNAHEHIEKHQKRFITSKYHSEKILQEANMMIDNPLTNSTMKNINDCGSWLEFRHYTKLDKTKLHKANHCKKDKLCPACAMRRASKQIQKVESTILQNEQLQKKHWYFGVLPVKHDKTESFDTVFARVKKSLDTWRTSFKNAKRKTGKKNILNSFDGLFYSIEITRSKNGWNIHINFLACSDAEIQGIYTYTDKNGKKISQHKDIADTWSSFTDNGSYMHSFQKVDTTDKEVFTKNLFEIFKYALKFQDLTPKDALHVYEKTKNKRLMGSIGCLYNMPYKVDLDKEETLNQEYIEMVFRYSYAEHKYIHVSTEKKIEEKKPKIPPFKPNKIKVTSNHMKDVLTDYDVFQLNMRYGKNEQPPAGIRHGGNVPQYAER